MKFIVSEIKQIIKDNPENYALLKEQKTELKKIKSMMLSKLEHIENTIRNSSQKEQKLNDAQNTEMLQKGSEIDELLAREKRFENEIIWKKINLNIPIANSEMDRFIASLKASGDSES